MEYGEEVGIIRMYNTTVSEYGRAVPVCRKHRDELKERMSVLAPDVYVEDYARHAFDECNYCVNDTDLLDYKQMSPTQIERTRRNSIERKNNVGLNSAAQTRSVR